MLEEKVEEVSALLKSLAHPLRLKILCLLQDQELTVGEIRDAVRTTGANVSQHLTILRNQGIIVSRREANLIHNRIADQRVVKLMNTMQNLYCQEE